MAYYIVTVSNGSSSTDLKLTDGSFFQSPAWECLDGAAVWGTPYKGRCMSPNLTGGHIELSVNTMLSDWSAHVGAQGGGYKLDENDGSFPTGDFSWECVSSG